MKFGGCIVALLFSVLLAGCSGDSGSKTIKASGIVMYKGQPVADASVAFLGDGKVRPAVAVTDEDGVFVLTTSRSGDGAVPGVHTVTVSKIVDPPKKSGSGDSLSMEDAALAAQSSPEETKTLYLVPEKYSMAETSGLSFTVESGAENYFEIQLED